MPPAAEKHTARLRLESLEDRSVPSAPGTLDPTFGSGGLVTTDLGSTSDRVRAIGQDAAGRLVAVGDSVVKQTRGFAVARYTASGALDTTFGTKGVTRTAVGS